MGIFDRVKDAFGEETVKKVHFAKDEEEVKREGLRKPLFSFAKKQDEFSLTKKQDKEEEQEEKKQEPVVEAGDDNTAEESEDDSVFAVEDDDFFLQKNDVKPPDPTTREEQVVGDILDVLGIETTFTISNNVFLPEDITKTEFDIQAPYGYDQGQVLSFKSQVASSLEYYISLLKQRNSDVAKLATTIDRLQVDLNNAKFDAEIGNGISIMPTNDTADLENKLMEARAEIARLKETDIPREQYSTLADSLTAMRKDNENLQQQVNDLTTQLALAQEENLPEVPKASGNVDISEFSDMGEFVNIDNEKSDEGLPDIDDMNPFSDDKWKNYSDESLPEVDDNE